MGDLTWNFNRSEFECKCGCGEDRISLTLVGALQFFRIVLKIPIMVTSGCRCVPHNKLVGGEINSCHLVGKEFSEAVDWTINLPGEKKYKILKKINKIMFPIWPGGYHYYFLNVEGIGTSTRFIEDCDIRAEGGYIIAPPSQRNGKSYTWMPDLSIFEIDRAELPANIEILARETREHSSEHYSNNNNTNINNRGIGEENSQGDNKRQHGDNKRQHFTTNDNISFEEGTRDESLFHVANCLIKGGMPIEEAQQILALMALKLCEPPFPQCEINAKIQSALKRSNKREKSLTQEIRDLLVTTNDNIMTTFVNNCLHLTTREEKKMEVNYKGENYEKDNARRV